MGLLSTYLAYRHGRKKAERRARRAEEPMYDEPAGDQLVCDNCGHRLEQHSDDDPPLCPNY